MAAKLHTTGLKWTQQARWGYRIYDFWCASLGLAVEIDGFTHNPAWDQLRDQQDYQRSGIIVLRVRNFNEEDARATLIAIATALTWNDRRLGLGLRPIRT